MSILYNFVLNIIAASFLVSQTDAFGVICAHSRIDFSLVNKIPANCDYILYSHQHIGDLNRDYDNNIITLRGMKPVIVEVSIALSKIYVKNLISDPKYEPTKVFTDYLIALNISGILLSMFDIHAERNMPTVEEIQNFIILLKTKMPDLKIGLTIDGYKSAIRAKETKEYKFDLLNEHLNFYYIDSSSTEDACNTTSSKFGRYRTSKDDFTYIKKLAEVVNESKMEKSKTVISLNISVINTRGTLGDLTTYGQYCKTKAREDKSNTWCAESMKQLYDLATYLEPSFGGFALMYINNDDSEDNCGCGIFPVSNAYTQGWNSGEIPTCSAISGPAV